MKLESYHEHTLQTLDHLHYLAVMTECLDLWAGREESRENVPKGFAVHLHGLRAAWEKRPAKDSPERLAMISGARRNGSAPFTVGCATAVSSHEAVMELAGRVLNHAPPRPVTFEKVLELTEAWLPSILPDPKTIESVKATLELEYLAADPAGRATGLTDAQLEAFRLICSAGPLLGRQIVKKLGLGCESTFTKHYVPALKAAGIVNKRGLGYYHPDTYHPD